MVMLDWIVRLNNVGNHLKSHDSESHKNLILENVKIKERTATLFSFFLRSPCMKSALHEWRNKSARRGAQLVPLGMPTDCNVCLKFESIHVCINYACNVSFTYETDHFKLHM